MTDTNKTAEITVGIDSIVNAHLLEKALVDILESNLNRRLITTLNFTREQALELWIKDIKELARKALQEVGITGITPGGYNEYNH